MVWLGLMRIRYIWTISKAADKESNLIIRNRDGDFSVIIFLIIILNRSLFDRYKLSYQPILRYFHLIAIGMFIGYCLLQLTQFVVIRKTGLISQQGTIKREEINHYSMKKKVYGYKVNLSYTKKAKTKNLMLIMGKKNLGLLEKKFKELDVKFV